MAISSRRDEEMEKRRRVEQDEKSQAEVERQEESEESLKKARSQAELTRVRQGWAQIALMGINIALATVILLNQLGVL